MKTIIVQQKINLTDLVALKPCRPLYTDYNNVMGKRHEFTVPGRTGSLIEILKKRSNVPFALSHRCPVKWVLFYN